MLFFSVSCGDLTKKVAHSHGIIPSSLARRNPVATPSERLRREARRAGNQRGLLERGVDANDGAIRRRAKAWAIQVSGARKVSQTEPRGDRFAAALETLRAQFAELNSKLERVVATHHAATTDGIELGVVRDSWRR